MAIHASTCRARTGWAAASSSRVESCFPIEDEESRRVVIEQGLEPYLQDNAQAWVLQPDGSYERAAPSHERHCAQEELLEVLTR